MQAAITVILNREISEISGEEISITHERIKLKACWDGIRAQGIQRSIHQPSKNSSCWLNNLIRLLRFLQNSCALEQLKRSFTFPTYRTLACTASCRGGRLNVPGDFLCMFAFICTLKINNGLPSPRSPPTIVRRSMLACE